MRPAGPGTRRHAIASTRRMAICCMLSRRFGPAGIGVAQPVLVDEAKLFVASGKGGDGMVSFRREKYVALGGPSGGDGGRGGDVVLQTDPNLNTLYFFRRARPLQSETGRQGRVRQQDRRRRRPADCSRAAWNRSTRRDHRRPDRRPGWPRSRSRGRARRTWRARQRAFQIVIQSGAAHGGKGRARRRTLDHTRAEDDR